MTDRLHSLTVALEQDIREDDAQAIIAAIRQLRGVLSVSSNVANPTTWTSDERARNELGKKIIGVIYPRDKA